MTSRRQRMTRGLLCARDVGVEGVASKTMEALWSCCFRSFHDRDYASSNQGLIVNTFSCDVGEKYLRLIEALAYPDPMRRRTKAHEAHRKVFYAVRVDADFVEVGPVPATNTIRRSWHPHHSYSIGCRWQCYSLRSARWLLNLPNRARGSRRSTACYWLIESRMVRRYLRLVNIRRRLV